MNKNKYKQMTKKKDNPNITKIKHRFGAFEIRLSDNKIEIQDYIRKQVKFMFTNDTRVYAQYHYLLNDAFIQDGEVQEKSISAKKDDLEQAESLVYILYSTLLFFEDIDFLSDYVDIFSKTLEAKEYKDIDDETDEEILENLKTEHEANEILKETDLRDDFLNAGIEY